MTYPTPEQIKQIAIECGFKFFNYVGNTDKDYMTAKLQALFIRAYELGWKNRGESDAKICDDKGLVMGNGVADICAEAIRNNTGE